MGEGLVTANKHLKVDDLDQLWDELPQLIAQDSGQAATALLTKGISAYYSDPETPPGLLIREEPSGVRSLVRVNVTGEDTVIRRL